MTTQAIRDVVERNISIRQDGAIVWESILHRHISPDRLRRILTLIEDHVTDEGHIDWTGVWCEERP